MRRWLPIAIAAGLVACSGRGDGEGRDAGDEDAGGGMDAGPRPVDSGPVDPGDSGPAFDAGPFDAGPCVECPRPGPGCTYVGGSCTECGELMCPDACVRPVCPPPPMGCRYDLSDPCTCGEIVCAGDAGPGRLDCGTVVCATTEYCDYPDGSMCGIGGEAAACTVRPDFCSDVYMPVCGCNGMTYTNDCQAAMAGVDTAYSGECTGPPTGRCRSDDDCPPGQRCELCLCPEPTGCRVCLPPGVMC